MPYRKRFRCLIPALLLALTLPSFTATASGQTEQKKGRRKVEATKRDLDDKEGDYENNARRAAKRDAFPVFDNPDMTAAGESSIDDQEYVIGVHCDGEAKAYPVAVMGRHELGNDICGETHITVSW